MPRPTTPATARFAWNIPLSKCVGNHQTFGNSPTCAGVMFRPKSSCAVPLRPHIPEEAVNQCDQTAAPIVGYSHHHDELSYRSITEDDVRLFLHTTEAVPRLHQTNASTSLRKTAMRRKAVGLTHALTRPVGMGHSADARCGLGKIEKRAAAPDSHTDLGYRPTWPMRQAETGREAVAPPHPWSRVLLARVSQHRRPCPV